MKITTTDIYEICNEKQWFTDGTNSQYEKMFDYVREQNIKASDTDKIGKLAVMIWICSDNEITEVEIYETIYKKALENKGVYIN